MADAPHQDRHSRRHNVKGLRLHCSKGGLLSFLSRASAGEELPVVNISVDGLQFLSGKSFEAGERLKLHLSGPEQAEPTVAEARVRWCRRIPRRAAHRVGVEFTSHDEETRKRLEEIEARIGRLTMRLACPSCGVTVTVSNKHEGRQAKCPRCKAPMRLLDEETLPEIPEEEKAHEHKPEEAEKPAAAAPAEEGEARPGRLSPALERFIRKTVPSRLHLDLVKHFAGRRRQQVSGVKDLSAALGVPPKRVQLALRELVTRGVLKEIGVKTFNYDPAPGPVRNITELLSALASSSKHSEVLALILKLEDGKA